MIISSFVFVIFVSIHASTREATKEAAELINQTEKFQSTPPHGRRLLNSDIACALAACFNPRLHTGGDRIGQDRQCFLVSFQSTPPHGRRLNQSPQYYTSIPFQSTPPHGRRPSAPRNDFQSDCFNPRLHTGGDWYKHYGCLIRNKFQSTPPHGRRQYLYFYPSVDKVFQSTPPHGRRHTLPLGNLSAHCFNPRLHTGGDLTIIPVTMRLSVSIHASTREATDLIFCT